MQNTSDFIKSLLGDGITVSLVDGLLKVEPKSLITEEIRTGIKKHKVMLIEALRHGRRAAKKNSCWTCCHYEEGGASWPGMCRYFERLGHEAKESDFKSVDSDQGCRFFLDSLQAAGMAQSTNDQAQGTPTTQSQPQKTAGRNVKLPSPVALSWLLEHRQALDDAGWTREELYSRKKYQTGIVWFGLWEEAFSMAYLHEDGTIEFECSMNGRDFFQTARPKKTWR
jgi:hypothetical protein